MRWDGFRKVSSPFKNTPFATQKWDESLNAAWTFSFSGIPFWIYPIGEIGATLSISSRSKKSHLSPTSKEEYSSRIFSEMKHLPPSNTLFSIESFEIAYSRIEAYRSKWSGVI